MLLGTCHVLSCLGRLWKDKDPKGCTLVTVTKGSPAKDVATGVSLSKGSCTLRWWLLSARARAGVGRLGRSQGYPRFSFLLSFSLDIQ